MRHHEHHENHKKHHKKHHRDHYASGGAMPPAGYAHGGSVRGSAGYEEDPGTEVYKKPSSGSGMSPAEAFVRRGEVHLH